MKGTPTTEQFLAALERVEDELTHEEWSILIGQRRKPSMAMTAADCAALLGSDSYRYGNLRYGQLGRRLAAAIDGYEVPRRANGSPRYWTTLATGHRGRLGLFVWTMHPALAAAVDQVVTRRGR